MTNEDPHIKFSTGEIIITGGEQSAQDGQIPAAYMILSGEAEIFTRDERGKKTHIAFIGPRQVVGEGSLLHAMNPLIYAVATMPTRCRIMDIAGFQNCLKTSSPFVISLLKLMASRYRSLLEDYEEEQ